MEKELFCDICGTCCNKADWSGMICNECAELNAHWGYFSNKDMTKHRCIMCEDCFDKVLGFIKELGGKVQEEHYYGNL